MLCKHIRVLETCLFSGKEKDMSNQEYLPSATPWIEVQVPQLWWKPIKTDQPKTVKWKVTFTETWILHAEFMNVKFSQFQRKPCLFKYWKWGKIKLYYIIHISIVPTTFQITFYLMYENTLYVKRHYFCVFKNMIIICHFQIVLQGGKKSKLYIFIFFIATISSQNSELV